MEATQVNLAEGPTRVSVTPEETRSQAQEGTLLKTEPAIKSEAKPSNDDTSAPTNEETPPSTRDRSKPQGKEGGSPAVKTESAVELDEEDGDELPAPKNTKKKHFCSMCWGGDTEDKLLFQCRECNVVYHNDCYRGVSTDSEELDGLQFESNENGLFVDTCIACASVGKTVRGRTRRGIHHELQISKRPYECCFCSVNDLSLPLPMHPIYDRNNGRPLILERGKKAPKEVPLYRLAFCHTLCAQVIGNYAETGGCVYPCLRDGKYGGFEGDDDDRSMGSDIETARNQPRTEKPDEDADPGQTISLYGIHHFCIVVQKKWKNYLKAIDRHRERTCLECSVQIDEKADDWRMAIPCMCCEPQERKEFRRCHGKKQECLKAMHVGCAMWGK